MDNLADSDVTVTGVKLVEPDHLDLVRSDVAVVRGLTEVGPMPAYPPTTDPFWRDRLHWDERQAVPGARVRPTAESGLDDLVLELSVEQGHLVGRADGVEVTYSDPTGSHVWQSKSVLELRVAPSRCRDL